MDTIYERIKYLRKMIGLSQQELAELTGYSDRSSIAKIEKGEVNLSLSKIVLFASVFHVTTSFLAYGVEDRNIYNSLCIDYVNVPLYHPIKCEADFTEEFIIKYIAIPSLNPIFEYFAQIATDDGMIDEGINKDDLLVFEKTNKIPNKSIGLFCINSKETVCRTYLENKDAIILKPMNSFCDPICITASQNELACFGKLKVVIKTFD